MPKIGIGGEANTDSAASYVENRNCSSPGESESALQCRKNGIAACVEDELLAADRVQGEI